MNITPISKLENISETQKSLNSKKSDSLDSNNSNSPDSNNSNGPDSNNSNSPDSNNSNSPDSLNFENSKTENLDNYEGEELRSPASEFGEELTEKELQQNDLLNKKELINRTWWQKNEDKFSYLYPNFNDSLFNKKIAEKKEFNDTQYDGNIYTINEHSRKIIES